MSNQLIERKDKIIEKIPIENLIGKTLEEIKIIGHALEAYENGFNAYGQLFLKIKNEILGTVLNMYCDRLVLGDDNIILEIEASSYDAILDFPTLYYVPLTPFIIEKIDVLGQRGNFLFEGNEIKEGWFENQNMPDSLAYIVNTENALMLISTDGRRIFLAHDTSPRFEIATSEAHINFMLSHKYGFEEGFFQLQRAIRK
jgi:hypothetical protein